MCVFLFRNPYPWSPPTSSINGFIRFLYLLSHHDWKSEPLIVEMETGKMTVDLHSQIRTKFNHHQKCVFVATEYDLDASFWPCMDFMILQRVKSLAKASLHIISQKWLSTESKWIKVCII